MSRRAGSGENESDNMLAPDIESGKMKSDTIYELMKLRDLQSFITKIYWLVIMCFFAIGIILALVLSDGTFSDVFMAENLLSTIGISVYILLVALMIMCNSHGEMRIILLLTILFFIGCLSGFYACTSSTRCIYNFKIRKITHIFSFPLSSSCILLSTHVLQKYPGLAR